MWKHYRTHGRHDLPWRKTRDPYKILVSEIMLQQTQVPRVLEKYRSFLKKFPNVRSLARSGLADVLKEWNGLGYNRRAKYLHDAAKVIVSEYTGDLKKATAERLPGVGPYTRAAVRTFAFNEPHMMIETNVRASFIHHFFPKKDRVDDRDLVPLIEAAGEGQDPRTWYWALMDHGSHMKKLHLNPTRRSASYAMQSKFVGSVREVRGAIIKVLNEGAHGDLALANKLAFEGQMIRHALTGLKKDGLVVSSRGSWRIA
ncbi:MAG: A/G-specific adenine glycosylase [Candidatus Pacebacteria bacterium]|nr:A/G-specific adenine glycosylase [Candidatus Paceibacterota bacterium]